MTNYPVHRGIRPFSAPEQRPGGRPLADDEYARDFARLDRASRQRALTLPESLRLEECIRRLDRREGWRWNKRKKRECAA